MTESFERTMAFARAIIADCDTPILDRLQKAHEAEIAELQGQYERKAIDLQKAHEHEMEQLRRSRFREGYEAGQHSMDAEHYQLKLRLQGLRFGDGSHENLSRLAYAIYPCPTGWGKESCEGLRDKIIEMLGGVHDEPAPTAATCGACDADCDCHNQQPKAVAYDVLGNERHKAVCELRYIRDCLKGDSTDNSLSIANAIGVKRDVGDRLHESICDRLIYLLGGNEKYFYLSVREDGSIDSLKSVEEADALIGDVRRRADQSHESSPTSLENETVITDELRKFADAISERDGYGVTMPNPLSVHSGAPIGPTEEAEALYGIADRIDEQFNRICWQQEAVLQQTIDTMVDERDEMQRERDEWRRGAEHEADKRKEYKGLFERYKDSYVEYVGRYNIAVREREELRKSLRMIAERIGVPHHKSLSMYGDEALREATLDTVDSKNKHIGALECQRDELRTELEDTRAALRLQFIADREAARRIGALHG